MSTFPAAAEVRSLPVEGAAGFSCLASAGLAAVIAVLGLSTIWPTMSALWQLWTTDALKSIGMFVPLVSFVLILRVWRSLGWEMEGSWWGLAILVGTMPFVVHVRSQSILIFVFSPKWYDLCSATLPGGLCLWRRGGSAVWRNSAVPGCFVSADFALVRQPHSAHLQHVCGSAAATRICPRRAGICDCAGPEAQPGPAAPDVYA